MEKGAKQYRIDHATRIKESDLKAMIEGVIEPDGTELSRYNLLSFSKMHATLHMVNPSNLQMIKQRFEPNSYGNKRDVLTKRIAAQSFHGSPNPTRDGYTNSEADQRLKRQAIPVPTAQLLPNRYQELEVYAYDTNQGVRNKMLLNASQFMCVSLAHRDDARSAHKLGNLLHMVGDTYSASHVQRSEPEGTFKKKCGTEKIQWHFSMDLISWKQHRKADDNRRDWRFTCLVEHASDLMKLWVDGRAAVRQESTPAAKLARANEHVAQTLGLLCDRVFLEDPEYLRRPAGGAAAGYSITSGTDWWEYLKFWKWKLQWKFWKPKTEDMPIQPVGLTGPEEARAFYKKVNDKLKADGGPEHFEYLSREVGDFCQAFKRDKPLPVALQCTRQEIDWAMRGAREVETLWIPARTQSK